MEEEGKNINEVPNINEESSTANNGNNEGNISVESNAIPIVRSVSNDEKKISQMVEEVVPLTDSAADSPPSNSSEPLDSRSDDATSNVRDSAKFTNTTAPTSQTEVPPISKTEKIMEKKKSKAVIPLPSRVTENKKTRKARVATIDIEKTSLFDLLPRCVSDYLSTKANQNLQTPITQDFECAALFLDISQFTVISEQFSLTSKLRGPETLAQYVNQLFTQIVRLVSKSGGDIFKFAGDAMIVLWSAEKETTLSDAALRAASCAWDIQETIPKLELADGLALRLKIGIGAGKAILVHVGLDLDSQNLGQSTRLESAAARIQAVVSDSYAKRIQSESQSGIDLAASSASAIAAAITISSIDEEEVDVLPPIDEKFSVRSLSEGEVVPRTKPAGSFLLGFKRMMSPSSDRVSTASAVVQNARRECLVMGDPLRQCFAAEHSATTGDIIASPETWELIKGNFTTKSKTLPGGFVKLDKQENPVKKKRGERGAAAPKELLLSYIPRSAHLFLEVEDESKKDWVSELRRVTVLFVNIGITKSDIAEIISTGKQLKKLQDCFSAVQKAVIDYEGSVNKFLIDDKGSTLVAVFGLPPISHENDAIRGVLCSLALSAALQRSKVDPAVGIASGTAFCGVVGHPGGRREYTVLGDIVNLAARLMQRATRKNDGVLVDSDTMYQAQGVLEFQFVKQIKVKGKTQQITVYRPHESDRKKRNIIERALFTRKHRRRSLDSDFAKQVANVANVETRRKSFFTQPDFHKAKEKILTQNVRDDHVSELISRMQKYVTASDSHGPYSVLLEGSIGIGKSRALSLLSSLLLTEQQTRVYMAVGNPFERGTLSKPFGVYITILNQAISQQHAISLSATTRGSHSKRSTGGSIFNGRSLAVSEIVEEDAGDISLHDRQAIVLRWLVSSNSKATKFAWLLNEDLGVNFYDKTSDEKEDIDEQNMLLMASKGELIFDLLKGISKDARVCILMDDAMYLDAPSWTLTLQIADRGHKINKGISVVVASRPVDEFVLIDTSSRASYEKFTKVQSVKYERMKPLDAVQVRELALKCLNVTSVPPVVELAIAKCQGNPLFVREMLFGMKSNNILEISHGAARVTAAAAAKWQDNDKILSCSRCESLFTSFNRKHHCRSCGRLFCGNCAPSNYKLTVVGYDTPQRHCIECYETPSARDYWIAKGLATVVLEPPVTIVCVMGTWIDKLSTCQQMILKVASLIQRDMRFSKVEVFDAYPIASHREILEEEFAELCKLGFIHLTNLDASDKALQRYEFMHNFLPDVLSQRMLSVQRNELLFHVSEMKERRDIATRKEFRESHKSTIMEMILMQGYILVHKSVDRNYPWKRRWATVCGYKMDFYADKEKKGNKPLASIDLRSAHVSIETQEFESRLGAIRIDALDWIRHDVQSKEKRSFFIAPESNNVEDSKKWAYFIKFGIETGLEYFGENYVPPVSPASNNANVRPDKPYLVGSSSTSPLSDKDETARNSSRFSAKKRDQSIVDTLFGFSRKQTEAIEGELDDGVRDSDNESDHEADEEDLQNRDTLHEIEEIE